MKAFALTVLVEEEADEFGDVFLPLPQRGERDLDHLESIVEILAELAAFDHLLEALMRRGEDPHIDGDSAPAAELLDLTFLQHAKQLRLQHERNVAHFVEEDRATARQLEFSRPGLDAGGHAALDAEELRLQQRLRQRGAVDGHEWLVFPRRIAVDEPRHHLLAGSRFAPNENVGLTGSDACYEVNHALHLERVSDHQPIGVLTQHPLLEVAVLVFQ